MRTTTHILGCTALALALSLTAGCADDDSADSTGVTPSPDIVIPQSTCEADESLACGYDGECADKGLELGTCTVARCINGCCAATAAPTFSNCEAQGAGPCEEGTCSDSGACIVVTATDGKFCNEEMSDACSSYTCQGGNCVANDLENCDDNNPCTGDTCAVTCVDDECSASCSHVAAENGGACSDQNACTGADACMDGVCVGSEDLCECTEDSDCTAKDTDQCDAVGLVCDVANSKCVESATDAVVCDDGEISTCEEVTCEPASGECVVSQKAEYASCDDGDTCTGCVPGLDECANAHDFCNANGVCQSGAGTPCACTEDVDCAAFDDGDLCNGGWACVEGACAAIEGIEVTCEEQSAPVCHTLACAPETGTCSAFPVAQGEPCTDDSAPNAACIVAQACSADLICEVSETAEDGTPCDLDGATCQAGVCEAPVVLTLCEEYCGAVANNCTDTNALVWTDDCATDCAGWLEGEPGDMDGNTTHCRLYHANAAADDAALHCPHASTDGDGVCVDQDLCVGVVCDAPPVASCDENTAMTYADDGTCSEGVCSYTETSTDCDADVCTDGACAPAGDPCADVVCDAPPAATCTGNTAMTYAADGTCSEGVCSYTETSTDCGAEVCTDGACAPAGDPCADVVCDAPPADGCDGNTALTYAASGTCSDGVCSYTETSTDCGADVCTDGACAPPADPCADVVCDAPPADGCDGNTALTYAASGTCSEGVCSYTETSTDCGAEVCTAGACEPAPPVFQCDAAYAGCTEEDFNANDMTAMGGTIDVEMVAMQPYSPKCLRVAVGQTVTIGATGGHPFEKVCAEDTVMDAQNESESDVTFTFTTPGYYNYKCLYHESMVGNIQVVSP